MANQVDAAGNVMVTMPDTGRPGDDLGGPADEKTTQMNAGVPQRTVSKGPSEIQENPTWYSPGEGINAAVERGAQPAMYNPRPIKTAPPATVPAPSQPHKLSRVFDGLFKQLIGGEVNYQDPVTGETRTAPQTKSAMAKAIVASALAGMLTPNVTKKGLGGQDIVDRSASAGAAFQTGMETMAARRAQPQQQADEQQTRRLKTLQNNIALAQQRMAVAHQGNLMLKEQVDHQKVMMAPVDEYEKHRLKTDPAAYMQDEAGNDYKDLLHDEALNVLGKDQKLFDQEAVMTGVRTITHPDGTTEDVPTYSIINPNFQVKLGPEQIDELKKFKRQYQEAYKLTGGNVTIPFTTYNKAVQESTSLLAMESAINKVGEEFVDTDGKKVSTNKVDLHALALKDPRVAKMITDALEHGLATGQPPDQVLKGMRESSNGNITGLLDAMGVSTDQLDQYIGYKENQRTAATERTKATFQKAQAAQEAEDKVVEETAKNLLNDPTGMASLTQLASLRKDHREKVWNRYIALGGSPAQMSLAKAKTETYESFNTADGKARVALQSYQTFLKHDGDLAHALHTLMSDRPQALPKFANKTLNDLEQYVGSDPDIVDLKAAIMPVRKEFMTFINNNKALFEDEAREAKELIDGNMPVNQLLRLTNRLGKTGFDRLDGYRTTYQNSFPGQEIPNLLDKAAVRGATRVGLINELKEFGYEPAANEQIVNAPGEPSKPWPPNAPSKDAVTKKYGKIIDGKKFIDSQGKTWVIRGGVPEETTSPFAAPPNRVSPAQRPVDFAIPKPF